MKKPRVGVVGEILVKFLPAANNYLVDLLESEGARGCRTGSDGLPALLLLQPELQGRAPRHKKQLQLRSQTSASSLSGMAARQPPPKHLQKANTLIRRAILTNLPKWLPISYPCGNQTGEGWFLTGEMLELIHCGVQ